MKEACAPVCLIYNKWGRRTVSFRKNMIDFKQPLRPTRLAAYLLISSLILFQAFLTAPPALADHEESWRLVAGGKNSITAHLQERSIETETKVNLGLETPNKLDLDLKLSRKYETGGKGQWGSEFELKIPVAMKDNDLNFYIRSALGQTVDEKQKIGVETELGGTDYDLGVVFEEGNVIGKLEFSRWFSSGITLKGKAELKDGYIFKNSEIKFDGINLSLKNVKWELSGKLEANLDTPPVLSSSLSLENETERDFSLSGQGKGGKLKGNIDREIEIDFKEQGFDELTFDWRVEFPWEGGEIHGDLKINHLGEIKKAAAGFRGNNLEMKISLAEGKAGLTYYPPGTGEDLELELGFTVTTKEELNSFLILELNFHQFKTESAIAINSTNKGNEIELKQVIEW